MFAYVSVPAWMSVCQALLDSCTMALGITGSYLTVAVTVLSGAIAGEPLCGVDAPGK